MQQWRAVVCGFFTILIALILMGCSGGGNNPNAVGKVATATLTPSPTVSLNAGDVVQMHLNPLDANGNVVLNQPVTFSSTDTANPKNIDVAVNGSLCGGSWANAQNPASVSANSSDSNPVVCTPATPGVGGITANITATVQGVTSNTVAVSVHQPVASIKIIPQNPACASQGGSVAYNAQALNSSGADISASVGAFTWTIANVSVGTLANSSTSSTQSNTVTAKLPGLTTVFASANSVNPVNSLPATFTECPVANIAITPASKTTLSAAGQTQQFTATVTDSASMPVSNVPLNWVSTVPTVATVSSAGLATAVASGTTEIIAACTPNACNINLGTQIFSNAATAQVTGSGSTTVYAASTSGTSLVPINTASNTAGTAITLPQTPNSIAFSPSGSTLFLGSANGLMVVNPATNVVSGTISNAPGTILAVSPNSNQVLVSNPTAGLVYDFLISSSTVSSFSIANATAAAFTLDGLKAYVVNGNTLDVVQLGLALTTTNLGSTASGVSVLGNGSLVFVADTGAQFLSTCGNNTILGTPGGAPALVQSVPDGSAMLGADSPNLDVIAVPAGITGCPPAVTPTFAQHNLGTAFTPQQIIVTPDGQHAYITSGVAGQLLRFDLATSNATPITLSSAIATTFTGGSTTDSATVYVGASDNIVHVIDTSTGTDMAQVPLTFTPNLVTVKP